MVRLGLKYASRKDVASSELSTLFSQSFILPFEFGNTVIGWSGGTFLENVCTPSDLSYLGFC
jgi:hypothetical protein